VRLGFFCLGPGMLCTRTRLANCVRPGESEAVEIPFNEGGGVDCRKSRIAIGRLCTTYLSVTMKWPDVERLAQADFERQLREVETPGSPRLKQAPQSASSAADMTVAKAGRKTKAVASVLLGLFPERRPALQNDELMRLVRRKAGEKLGGFSARTLDRSIQLAWPRQTSPKYAKPR
jgi:hypothetical protein